MPILLSFHLYVWPIVLKLTLGFRTCRLTGAAVFTGVGTYALVQANQQGAFKRIRPQGAPVVAGKITALIGTGELNRFENGVYDDTNVLIKI